jgi:phenylacetate-CoA ligase
MDFSFSFWKIYEYWATKRLFRTDLDTLRTYQNEALKKLIQTSYKFVPFYSKLYKSVRPEECKGIDFNSNIDRFPVITKELMKKAQEKDLISEKCENKELIHVFSSGSTGTPFITKYSLKDKFYRDLTSHFIYSYFHIHPCDRMGYFTLYDPAETDSYFFQKFGIWKIYQLGAERSPKATLKRIKDKKITYVSGFPSLLYFIAQENLKDGERRYKLKKIFTRGEYLPKELREFVEYSFQTKITDIYALSEAGLIAFECEKGRGYHLTPHCKVEIVSGDKILGENTLGDIVITPLYSYTMPFIRYNTKDRGELDFTPCECGLNTPRLKNLQGRASNFFINKNSDKFSSMQMFFAWQFIGEVYRFTLSQNEIGKIEIQIVLSPGVDKNDFDNRLRNLLFSKFQDNFEFAITYLNGIEEGTQGKFLGVVSYV